ncbi:MAG TPA: hypothetical protein VGF14_00460 [Alphaproteobacteria bacterium]
MSDFVASFPVVLRIALIDADHRVLLLQDKRNEDAEWDFPGVILQRGDDPLEHLADYLRHHYRIETFPKAFFPLTFALADEDSEIATLLYGCRNWTGPQGLQHILAVDERLDMQWVKPVRMADYALAASCSMMVPNVITLLG